MIIKNTPELAEKVSAAVDGKIMFKNNNAETILLTLLPGETIPQHTNPFDVLLLGVQGTATLKCGTSEFKIDPCQTIFVSREEPRQIQNHSDLGVKIFVVKLLG
jgi:quercetin dioxygenase-like cupin family protein